VRAIRIAAATTLAALVAGWCNPALAQTQPRRQAPPPARRPSAARSDQGVRARVFGEAGARRFTSAQTFEAVLGSSIGPLFGGGVEVLWGHLSVEGSVLRYRGTGERVFVSDGEVFPLNIPTTVTLLPIAVTVSYRVPVQGSVIPFVGGGINVNRYTETSEFADDGENASSTFTGLHVQGGVEWRLTRRVGIAGVGRWASVRDAIGTEPTSAATAFGEHDLGGFDAAVRIIFGRR
jgi:opacity protein-like surface antigen